ncbi:preprotein translocase subunit SecE [Synechococcus sp. RSCCF101]|uniref:preprotein translocase subunit SecE n=1 Tax=Synechococcus sp. RSCCF101 TaxID=2511069 RepID=UPI001CD9ED49|nr:preprotein translocase subunit SecE [Synechococcus sp. RSCCF101]
MSPSASPEDTTVEPTRSAAPAADAPGAPPVPAADESFAAKTMAELRMVVWPSRQQLFSESVAVILMVSLSAAAIAAVDRFYSWGAGLVFR